MVTWVQSNASSIIASSLVRTWRLHQARLNVGSSGFSNTKDLLGKSAQFLSKPRQVPVAVEWRDVLLTLVVVGLQGSSFKKKVTTQTFDDFMNDSDDETSSSNASSFAASSSSMSTLGSPGLGKSGKSGKKKKKELAKLQSSGKSKKKVRQRI